MRYQLYNDKRSGVVLLVVMGMLALFAAVGLSFVFFAESEATSSRYNRMAEVKGQADVEPELLLSYFMGQFLYDTDDVNGVFSALRGHSLARNLYGFDPNSPNTVPFNGTGVLQYQVTYPPKPAPTINNLYLINYQAHPSDGMVRDPERYGQRVGANPLALPPGPFVGGANVPSTYPSMNNVMLGALNADGEILIQSGHRPWNGINFANTTDPWQKYLTLRPHRSYHPNFADPEDLDQITGLAGGDVRNLEFGKGVKKPGGGYFNNDSFWMDLGFPVQTAANGKKYKPLFAPLIIDLDNRINLHTAGNILDPNFVKHSRQGLGRWEVNINRVLPNPAEVRSGLFQGTGARYGANGVPDGPGMPLLGPARYYAPYDGDGISAANLSLPVTGNTFTIFPSVAADWASGGAGDNPAAHPAKFTHLLPKGVPPPGDDSKGFAVSNMEALLRYGGKGSPALTSELFRRLPTTMANMQARGRVTLLSNDLDRTASAPYIPYDPATTSLYAYDYPAQKYPITLGVKFPQKGTTDPIPGSEFDAGWRSLYVPLSRINLHRFLTDYPAVNGNGIIDLMDTMTAQPQFLQAHSDRNKFAQEIYDTLSRVTGARSNLNGLPVDDPQYRADRYLAQLAVNIVDYIDKDDISTPFLWIPPGGQNPETLFGVELPRVVLNELHVQYDNDPQDPGLQVAGSENAQYYKMNVWAELYNPFKEDAALHNTNAGFPIYRIQIARADANLRSPENNLGRPDPAKVLATSTDWGNTPYLNAGDNQFDNTAQRAFFVQGPKPNATANNHFMAGRNPNLPTTNISTNMSVQWALNDPMISPTVFLQRLANPLLPHNEADASAANYNPYITIDYVENVPAYNGVIWEGPAARMAPPVTDFSTLGRRQPYAAHGSQQVAQNPNPPPANQAKNTFLRQNSRETATPVAPGAGNTIDTFQWLVHLDRKPINAMELLHVCGYRPHEFTQQFIQGPAAANWHLHIAPWQAPDALLYRFLEYAGTPDLMNGPAFGGRRQGKVNINTVWDREVFRALCDPQPGSNYDVDAIFDRMMVAKMGADLMITGDDLSFKSLAAGYTPAAMSDPQNPPSGISVESTILGRRDGTGRIFELNAAHPYQKNELLMKLFTNITTRSNVFAVWVTVGFFEVVDDTVQPPRLGAEIGKADNRHVRHRFFAIVDRTEMRMRPVNAAGQETPFSLANATVVQPGQTSVLTLQFPGRDNLVFPNLNGRTWEIKASSPGVAGTMMVINPNGVNEETLEVVATSAPGVNPAWLKVNATQSHAVGEEVICRGNPGPWVRYNVRQDPKVVPHYSIIE